MNLININDSKQLITNVLVGDNVKFFNFVNVYGCSIDSNTKVGSFVEIQKDVVIGKNCKISSHSFVCSGVTIEDNVFIGHGVMFTNDLFPRSTNIDGSLQDESDWYLIKTLIKKGASIGSNVTLICGITVGENSLIGAGSVVTKDIPDNVIVVGNPAKILKSLPKI